MIKTHNPQLFELTSDLSEFTISKILEYIKLNNLKKVKLLDIGGGMEFGKVLFDKDYIDYYCLDLNIKRNEDRITYIQGDITNTNLDIDMDLI
jgi:hypothetical protein